MPIFLPYHTYLCLFFKVPGRMGMIVTLFLISANVYNSVEAPKARGFSYIEVWMIGSQIPILLALLEYGFILYLKKMGKKQENMIDFLDFQDHGQSFDARIRKLDFATLIISFLYFITFKTTYWIFAIQKHSNSAFTDKKYLNP